MFYNTNTSYEKTIDFTNEEGKQLRVILDNSTYLFCFRDLLHLLEIKAQSTTKYMLSDAFGNANIAKRPVKIRGRVQQVVFLTEEQMTYLLRNCYKSKEKVVKRYLEEVVLPKLRVSNKDTRCFINKIEVTFKEENNIIYISSRDVADIFEREHTYIIRAIDNLPNDGFKAYNFKSSSYIDNRGKSSLEYKIARDGFFALAVSFNNQRMYKQIKALLSAFNKAEKAKEI